METRDRDHMSDEYPCRECDLIWNTERAAEACELRDIEEAKHARINPPRRDPNIIRSNN